MQVVQARCAGLDVHKKVAAACVLSAVVSDVTGVSARAMLRELIAGRTDAEALADLAAGRLREKVPALQQALAGRFGAHHQYLAPHILAAIDYLDGAIANLDAQIAERVRPFEEAVERLDEIPGVGRCGCALHPRHRLPSPRQPHLLRGPRPRLLRTPQDQ